MRCMHASDAPMLVAYKDPTIPPRDAVRNSAPKAFPLLLACNSAKGLPELLDTYLSILTHS